MATSFRTEVKDALKAADGLVAAILTEGKAYEGTEIEKVLTQFIGKMNEMKDAADDNYTAVTIQDFQMWKADLNGTIEKVHDLLFPASEKPRYWMGTPIEVAFNDFRLYADNVESDLKNATENYMAFEKSEITAQAYEVVDDIVKEHHADVMKYLRTDHLKAGEKKFIAMTDKTSLKFNLALLKDMLTYTDKSEMSLDEIGQFNAMSNALKHFSNRVNDVMANKGTIGVNTLMEIKQSLEMIQQNCSEFLKDTCPKFDAVKVVLANTCATLADYVKASPNAFINIKNTPDAQSRAFTDAVITEGFDRAKRCEKVAAKRQAWHDEAMAKHKKEVAAKKAAEARKAEEQARIKAAEDAISMKDHLKKVHDFSIALENTNASLFTKQSKQFATLTDSVRILEAKLCKKNPDQINAKDVAEALYFVKSSKRLYDRHCEKHHKDNAVRRSRVELSKDLMKEVDMLIRRPEFHDEYVSFSTKMAMDNKTSSAAEVQTMAVGF